MLSDEQQQVVDSIDHFIFLLAGAGSGKTRVIVEKIKKCLEQGVSADKILAITFTKKASHEMMERI
ncbi:MAG: UvrD-helicase domain-containing protein, partial [Acholeplasmataceae bacterium]